MSKSLLPSKDNQFNNGSKRGPDHYTPEFMYVVTDEHWDPTYPLPGGPAIRFITADKETAREFARQYAQDILDSGLDGQVDDSENYSINYGYDYDDYEIAIRAKIDPFKHRVVTITAHEVPKDRIDIEIKRKV